jgi:hypothetical protein
MCLVLWVVFPLRSARAEGHLTLAGRWNAGPLTERWNIGDWAPACGPRPTARELPGGAVTVREEGAELVIAGGGRTFRSNECWEQYPGVTRGSHSVSERSWRTRCNSAPSDPRQTTVVTSIAAADATIELDETGEYQFRIDGQNCTASIRRSRSFALLQREGEAPTALGASSAADPSGAASARVAGASSVAAAASARPGAPRCAVVGEPIRLDVRPARKILRPGEQFAFRTLGIDANGCAADMRGTWSVLSAASKVNIAGATIEVPSDAQDGTVELAVSLNGRTARVVVDVATPARYDALLASGSPLEADGGVAEEAATAAVSSTNLGTSTAVAQDGARTRKTAFVAIIGTLALGLAGLGFYLLRRNAADTAGEHPDGNGFAGPLRPLASDGALSDGAPAGVARVPAVRTVVCPSCGTDFPAGSTFCPHDGSRLGPPAIISFQGPAAAVPGGTCPTCGRGYDPGVRACPIHGDELVPAAAYRAMTQRDHGPVTSERGKICPSCGGRYGAPASFCGKDGTALVLVN